MQIEGKLSREDVSDAQRLLRPRHFWPKVVYRNAYTVLFVGAILGATIAGLVGATHPKWGALGIAWLFVLALTAWVVFRVRRATQKQWKRLNGALPDWIDLSDKGMKMDGPNGASSFQPWANFKGWREGQRVILVDRAQAGGPVVLPVANMSEAAREPIRQLLQSHLASPQTGQRA